MSNPNVIKVLIEPTWNILKEVNNRVDKLLPEANKNLVESVTMVVTELIENAIKYGETTSNCHDIEFELKIDTNKITVKVSNGVLTNANARALMDHIKKIQKNKNPEKLYTERLRELMDNPKPGVSQLGLYRIPYEGKFNLDYTFENTKLTIIAEKELYNQSKRGIRRNKEKFSLGDLAIKFEKLLFLLMA